MIPPASQLLLLIITLFLATIFIANPLSLVVSTSIASSSDTVSHRDMQILVQSRAQLVGTCKLCLTSWKLGTPANSVVGVSHAVINGQIRITGIGLKDGNLDGSVPDSWSGLEYLSDVDLSENRLTGTLPTSWSALQRMKSFDVSVNLLTGELVSSYSSWSEIRKFIVSSNMLQGSLPVTFGKGWPFISEFVVYSNKLTQQLPEEYSLWTELTTFSVSDNLFTGTLPSKYANWKKLIGFDVSTNPRLGGPLPPEYSSWHSIDIFFIYNCRFASKLPATYSAWRNISEFDVSNNKELSGPIPPEYKSWGRLTTFAAQNCAFNGTLPAEYGTSWKSLIELVLSHNKLTGSIPESFASLASLETINLQNNNLDGVVPASLCNLKKLLQVDLSQNCIDISGETLDCLSQLPTLRKIDLTPRCFSVLPFLTTTPLSEPYKYTVVNKQSNSSESCQEQLEYRYSRCITPELQYFSAIGTDTIFQFGVSCEFGNDFVSFPTSCMILLFRPVLECFLDDQATIPCSTNPLTSSFPIPSYQTQTAIADVSPFSGLFTFNASGFPYIHGVHFRLFIDGALNFATNFTLASGEPSPLSVPLNATSAVFRTAPCQLNFSVAIPYSTDCTVCPELAVCDGTTSIFVSDQKPSWRYSSKVLPFYECDSKTTKGCLQSSSKSENNNNNHNNNNNNNNKNSEKFDGSSCKAHFMGFLCARCEFNYGMVNGECSKCPETGSMIGVFCGCIIGLLVIATLLVYVSLDSVKRVDADDEDYDECCDCSTLEKKLHEYRPQLEKLTVTVRMLINHFTLLGALASTSAAKHATDSLRGFLEIQNSGGGGALLGAYSATLSCLFSTGSSDTAGGETISSSVLNFNILWIVFVSVFAFESIFFFAFTRKLTSTAAVALFLSFVAFSPLAQASSKLLALCHDYYFYDTRDYLLYGAQKDLRKFSFSFLSTDLAQECNDTFMSTSRVGAALTISLFCGLLPFIIAFAYKKIQSEDARAAIFSFMTEKYKSEAWYYELVVMVRKLLIALVISIFVDRGDLQLQLYTLVTTMMLVASLLIQPLQSKVANIVDQVSISSALVCATFLSVIASFSDSEGVAITSTVFIFLTQIVAILAIVLFSHASQINDRYGFLTTTTTNGRDENKRYGDHLEQEVINNSGEAAGTVPLIVDHHHHNTNDDGNADTTIIRSTSSRSSSSQYK